VAYIIGAGPAPTAAKAAAALAAEQLAVLGRAMRGLTPKAQAEFMAVFIDGLCNVTGPAAGRTPAPSVIVKAAGAGERNRVSKKPGKAGGGSCCGKPLKAKAKRCPRCGKPTITGLAAGAAKAATKAARADYVAKSATAALAPPGQAVYDRCIAQMRRATDPEQVQALWAMGQKAIGNGGTTS
jgi:hypothetical protein